MAWLYYTKHVKEVIETQSSPLLKKILNLKQMMELLRCMKFVDI